MKAARVDTKQKLEQLVQRLNEHQRRVRLVEEGEVVAPAATGAPAAQAANPAAGKPAQTPEPLDKKVAASSKVTVDTVEQQLNTIRAGKSLKDTLVKQELARYFDGLDVSEQEALHAYLKGIAQIVSGQVDAGSAEEPSNHGVETKTTNKKSRQIKPNVIKKSSLAPKPSATGAASVEDTTAPTAGPIVPKKR